MKWVVEETKKAVCVVTRNSVEIQIDFAGVVVITRNLDFGLLVCLHDLMLGNCHLYVAI